MTFDLNDAELPKSNDLIPDGTFAKVTMVFRDGHVDGESELDRNLLRHSNATGSDVLLIDAEFTVAEGPYARRKFWQNFTVAGGKLDEAGVSIGWKITKSTFRAIIDSALGLDPKDDRPATKEKRVIKGLSQLSGLTFVAKIKVEASRNPSFSDSNKLERVVMPTEPEWQKVMDGHVLPPQPTLRGASKTSAPVNVAHQPWQRSGAAAVSAAWNKPLAPPAPSSQPAVKGPDWLNS